MTIDDDILKQLLRINDEGLEGVSFDAVSEEPGRSIRDIDDRSIRDLVEHINPFLKGWREHCQENLPRDTEDEFGFLTADLADTGFALGVLFGAMVQGASEQEIDRLDRGFIHSNARRWWYREGTMCRWRPLRAQIDSSVGGKTGVNHQEGKNLVGCSISHAWC